MSNTTPGRLFDLALIQFTIANVNILHVQSEMECCATRVGAKKAQLLNAALDV